MDWNSIVVGLEILVGLLIICVTMLLATLSTNGDLPWSKRSDEWRIKDKQIRARILQNIEED